DPESPIHPPLLSLWWVVVCGRCWELGGHPPLSKGTPTLSARGKYANHVVVTIAREMVVLAWAVALTVGARAVIHPASGATGAHPNGHRLQATAAGCGSGLRRDLRVRYEASTANRLASERSHQFDLPLGERLKRHLGPGFEARNLLGYIDHQLLADILEAQMRQSRRHVQVRTVLVRLGDGPHL